MQKKIDFEKKVQESNKNCQNCMHVQKHDESDIDDEGRGQGLQIYTCGKHFDSDEDRIEKIIREYKPINLSLNQYKIVANICDDFTIIARI